MITTFEMATSDRAVLAAIPWQCIIVDEAHRLKNADGKLAVSLREYHRDHCVLLTGTPLQNNTQELWALLNFLSAKDFGSKTEFLEQFGNLKESTQVRCLTRSRRRAPRRWRRTVPLRPTSSVREILLGELVVCSLARWRI